MIVEHISTDVISNTLSIAIHKYLEPKRARRWAVLLETRKLLKNFFQVNKQSLSVDDFLNENYRNNSVKTLSFKNWTEFNSTIKFYSDVQLNGLAQMGHRKMVAVSGRCGDFMTLFLERQIDAMLISETEEFIIISTHERQLAILTNSPAAWAINAPT